MDNTKPSRNSKVAPPGVLPAFVPMVFLITALAGAVILLGPGPATNGPLQLAFIVAGLLTGAIGLWRGIKWKHLEETSYDFIGRAIPLIFILLAIGILVGVWIATGVIPTLIYYSLTLISPSFYYVATLILCALVSIVVGSSWTSAGTMGVALIAAASLAGLPTPIVAGAVISGAYFGDKLSPLSDTTNFAAGMTQTQLFDHIKFLLWTTVPAFIIAVIGFTILTFRSTTQVDLAQIDKMSETIASSFTISPIFLIPLIVTLVLAARRVSPFIALLTGAAVAAFIGLIFQTALTSNGLMEAFKTLLEAAGSGYQANTGTSDLDSLLSRGGMVSFLVVIWIALASMFFAGMMDETGSFPAIARFFMHGAKSGGAIMRRAGLTSIVGNIVLPSQLLTILVVAQMYSKEFSDQDLESKSLSRVLEDYGTVTSPMVPWNNCGIYMTATLGVGTLTYLPYCFFNIASPIISFLFSIIGFQVAKSIQK